MKYLIVLCVMLAGCGYNEADYPVKPKTLMSTHSAHLSLPYTILCIDGVEYLHNNAGSGSVMVPHFKPDGSLYTCQ